MEHVNYDDKELGQSLMENVIYVTSLRHPFSRLQSDLNYKQTKYNSNFTLLNINIKMSLNITKELADNDKGFKYVSIPEMLQNNIEKIQTFVREKLGKFFQIVLITEYFDESLILMKRKLCWDLKDMLYFKMKTGNYSYKNKSCPPEHLERHKHVMVSNPRS